MLYPHFSYGCAYLAYLNEEIFVSYNHHNMRNCPELRVYRLRPLLPAFLLLALTSSALSQNIDTSLFANLRWRMIGPHRGGRTVGGCGVPQQPNVFYIGVNNGGVWKTTDFGRTWDPIFDSQPTGSIGDVAVAPPIRI
jgi:hypothetical protein